MTTGASALAEIINLRKARKAKERSAAEKQAEQNRAKFGQTKAEKTIRKLEEARAAKAHDAGRIEADEPKP
jgi:Domain of unknown function (DUF4169)